MLRLVLGIACALNLILSGVAGAQDYPTRPIRLIVGYGAGGSTDLAARIVADAHGEDARPADHGREPARRQRHGRARGRRSRRRPTATRSAMTSGSILTVLPWTMDIGFDPLKLTFIGSTHESFYALFVQGRQPVEDHRRIS